MRESLARMYAIDLAAAITRKFNATSDKNGFPQKLLPKAPSSTGEGE